MNKELTLLLSTIQEAGEAILTLQKAGFSIARKSNNDIVTQADWAANDILKKELLHHFPKDGWLSEETVDDFSRLTCHRTWIVDPIDGTKEFAQGLKEYAISVALVEDGIPVVASVYNPATQELFYAERGQGAWLNGKKIHCTHTTNATENISFLASRSEYVRGDWKRFELYPIKQIGSIAYKLALIAAGRADATFSLGPKNEWDIAAGVLLVLEAGGIVTDKKSEPFIFNRKNVLVDGIVATAASIHQQVFDLLRR